VALRTRLKRLEQLRPAGPTLRLAFVNDEGRVLDSGSETVKPWVGRDARELPGGVQLIRGVDPQQVLGRRTPGQANSSEDVCHSADG
jgi:hypothetical protein